MNFLKINIADNVAVALEDLPCGMSIVVDEVNIMLNADIPRGHKFSLKDIAVNEDVIKYGYPIGHAVVPVNAGDWVNEKTIKTNLDGVLEYSYHPVNETPDVPENISKTNTNLAMFEGAIAVELKRKTKLSDNEIMSYLDNYDNFVSDAYYENKDALTTTREIIEMLKQKGYISKDINYDNEDNSELPWDAFD